MNKSVIKKIIFVIGIIMLIVAIVAITMIKVNKNVIEKNNNEIIGESNAAEENMEPINTTIALKDILQEVKNDVNDKIVVLEDNKANELVDLKKYVGLEKMVAQSIDDNKFLEVWLVKISKESQSVDLFRIFNKRIENLKEEYKHDEIISNVIRNESNIVIKQQNGIVIMIISNDVNDVENVIDSKFKNI